MTVQVLHGDCLEVLRGLDDCSVDAVITDPPYGLSNTKPAQVADVLKAWVTGDTATVPAGRGFMGASWDGFVPPPAVWEECYRVLKPGGHMAVFAGARTQDLMGLSIRLAGFEIRDTLGWVYGSGFPKSMDIGKAIDKSRNSNRERQLQFTEWMRSTGITVKQISEATGTATMGGHYLDTSSQPAIATADLFDKLRPLLPEVPERIERLVAERTGIEWSDYVKREVVGAGTSGKTYGMGGLRDIETSTGSFDLTTPASDSAKRWDGWGTAIKPAWEPILLAQKPLNLVPLYEVANRTHHMLGALKWLSLSPAKRAEITSTSSHQERHGEMCAFVLANVETEQSPEKYDATDTFSSQVMALTYLSTEKLWQNILGAISDPTITFTTSTESSTITVLKTLNSLLGPITSATTMPPCECLLNGQPSNVISAESNSSESWSNWQATLNVSVPESVIEQTAKTALSLLANIAENLSQPGTAAGGGSVLSHAQIGLVTQSGESQNEHVNGAGSLTSLAGIRGGSVQSAAQQNSSAIEPIILARKPLVGTVAANVLAHGVGGLNIDACRVGTDDDTSRPNGPIGYHGGGSGGIGGGSPAGRFPANVLLDEHAAQEMDEQSGVSTSPKTVTRGGNRSGASGLSSLRRQDNVAAPGDSGGASRFFPVFKYQAKAPKKERPVIEREDGTKVQHATVKPLALMEWLCTLITPPCGTILDPFAGSGTTLEAARNTAFNAIGIEQEADYVELINKRLGNND